MRFRFAESIGQGGVMLAVETVCTVKAVDGQDEPRPHEIFAGYLRHPRRTEYVLSRTHGCPYCGARSEANSSRRLS